MGFPVHALYLDLAEDLQSQIPSLNAEINNLLRNGEVGSLEPAIDDTTRTVAGKAILKSFYKKFVGRTSESADAAALDKFLSVNMTVGSWSIDREQLSLLDDLLLGEFREEITNFFYPGGVNANQPVVTDFPQLFAKGRTGPGASILAVGGDFYSKLFSSKLSCTSSGLYSAYLNCISNLPTWAEAEENRSRLQGEECVVPGSRLCFAPKNVDISRLICTEPSLNMFFQLGLGRVIEERLVRAYGIDLSSQPFKNRDLAQIGSTYGSISTIDLESASDSVSLGMLRWALPSECCGWFEFLRSPCMELPDGSLVNLNMVSTMGNGFTFPLQTAIFSAVVRAAAKVDDFPLKNPRGSNLGNWGVFGDDIIAPKRITSNVLRLLSLLGFKVNGTKSFIEGPFRESCGADYWYGANVRGVYVKSLSTQEERYTVINRLNEWSAQTGISLTKTIARLIRSVRYLPVPLWENDDAGIKVCFSMVEGLRRDKDMQAILYRKRVNVPKCMTLGEGDIKVPRGVKARIYNSPGLLLAVLNGVVRDGKIGVRLDANRYRTRQAVAPNWDWLPPCPHNNGLLPGRLETALWNNMCYSIPQKR